ncbi:MAG: hypothetical protein ACRENB_02330 [Gemmatimonadales bacterium]
MTEEPEYLKRLRRSRAEKHISHSGQVPVGRPDAQAPPGLSPQEHETLRWAREIAGTQELRSIRNLAASRFAVLVRLQSASGTRFLSVEGLPSRDALKERVKPGATVGEEVLGAYEVRGGRPVTIAMEQGQVSLKMGTPRPGANPVSPERMLRKAAAEAETRAKTRPRGRER